MGDEGRGYDSAGPAGVFARGRTIKEIARDLHIARNTVRKILRSGETSFRYEREVQPLPEIGPWKSRLDELLRVNAGRSSRERLTLIRLYEELRGLGYIGSYDAVRRYAKGWSRERGAVEAEAFVPLSFAPGEAYQFDWSHEIVLIAGVTSTVKVAHVRLCYSRMMFVRAYPRETQEMVTLANRSAPFANASAHFKAGNFGDGQTYLQSAGQNRHSEARPDRSPVSGHEECRQLRAYSRKGQNLGIPGMRGWGGRIRTSVWRNQNPLPYRLATPHRRADHSVRAGRGQPRDSPSATLAKPLDAAAGFAYRPHSS